VLSSLIGIPVAALCWYVSRLHANVTQTRSAMDPLDRRAKLDGASSVPIKRSVAGDSYPRGEGALVPCSLTAGGVRPAFLFRRDGQSRMAGTNQARGGFSRHGGRTPRLPWPLLSFRPIHRLKGPTEPEGRFHYGVNRTRSQTFSANTQKDLPWPTSKKFLVLFSSGRGDGRLGGDRPTEKKAAEDKRTRMGRVMKERGRDDS